MVTESPMSLPVLEVSVPSYGDRWTAIRQVRTGVWPSLCQMDAPTPEDEKRICQRWCLEQSSKQTIPGPVFCLSWYMSLFWACFWPLCDPSRIFLLLWSQSELVWLSVLCNGELLSLKWSHGLDLFLLDHLATVLRIKMTGLIKHTAILEWFCSHVLRGHFTTSSLLAKQKGNKVHPLMSILEALSNRKEWQWAGGDPSWSCIAADGHVGCTGQGVW
jgi:hypothetical protein